ncbi:hypothetical protein [uncultured Clostridium sp.]|uniref:hypothetical protein n=1 Tax=uncultured Clostridium sp. TaxID=59620 RepID=UPI00260157D7|nr:hypothetical protein [uncultured Clostridium sp.]
MYRRYYQRNLPSNNYRYNNNLNGFNNYNGLNNYYGYGNYGFGGFYGGFYGGFNNWWILPLLLIFFL